MEVVDDLFYLKANIMSNVNVDTRDEIVPFDLHPNIMHG